jgi:hypothetical protein
MSRSALILFLVIELASVAGLLILNRSFERADDERWISYFSPPEPPVNRLEGLTP